MAGIPFRYAMCNEAFEGRPFGEVCRILRGFGYDGIEIAPFTLAADPLEIDQTRRSEYRAMMADEGIAFAGLHWLLVTPKQIHVTTADRALREESWRYVGNLVISAPIWGRTASWSLDRRSSAPPREE